MKKILGLIAVLVLSVAAFGQTQYGVVAQGGTITGGIGLVGRPALNASVTIGVVIVNNTPPFEFETGTIAFTIGPILSGSMQTGATFGSGGTITVTTANEGLLFSGTFQNAAWTPIFNSNSTHFYKLMGNFIDASGNTGSFLLTTNTATSVTCFFSGSEAIHSTSLGFIIH